MADPRFDAKYGPAAPCGSCGHLRRSHERYMGHEACQVRYPELCGCTKWTVESDLAVASENRELRDDNARLRKQRDQAMEWHKREHDHLNDAYFEIRQLKASNHGCSVCASEAGIPVNGPVGLCAEHAERLRVMLRDVAAPVIINANRAMRQFEFYYNNELDQPIQAARQNGLSVLQAIRDLVGGSVPEPD